MAWDLCGLCVLGLPGGGGGGGLYVEISGEGLVAYSAMSLTNVTATYNYAGTSDGGGGGLSRSSAGGGGLLLCCRALSACTVPSTLGLFRAVRSTRAGTLFTC